MLIVADVHGNADALRRVAGLGEPVVVLGDLINYIDYRTADGILADVAGSEWVWDMIEFRTAHEWDKVREHWETLRSEWDEAELRAQFHTRIELAYASICSALDGSEAYVTYGNVDRPDRLQHHLPSSATYIESGVVEIEGTRVGIVGGGIASPLGVPGEVSDEDLGARLEQLGPVDVLGTHVPPAIPQLATDVVAGTNKGSTPVLEYIQQHQPDYHFFGDIHQPQAVSWKIGRTRCRNVGYFRATARAVRHRPA